MDEELKDIFGKPDGADDGTGHPSQEGTPVNEPPPAVVAALEFQVAALVNDQRASWNWHGREIVVNEPGGLKRKLNALLRIAKSKFPRHRDAEDVLSETIHEYGLWKWANPFGFWTAFKRNIIDASKAAFESKRVHVEPAEGAGSNRQTNHKAESPEVLKNHEAVQNWLVEQSGELHAAGPSVAEKWDLAQASDHQLDRLITGAAQRLRADDGYMEELSQTERQVAKLTRLVAEIRSRTGCSQAAAYRLLAEFSERYSRRSTRNSS